jgi:hypothetical protein
MHECSGLDVSIAESNTMDKRAVATEFRKGMLVCADLPREMWVLEAAEPLLTLMLNPSNALRAVERARQGSDVRRLKEKP